MVLNKSEEVHNFLGLPVECNCHLQIKYVGTLQKSESFTLSKAIITSHIASPGVILYIFK